MKKVVFDIETRNTFQSVGSHKAVDLDLSLLVAYDYETDQYSSYLQEDLPKLWRLLENADLIIGYNSDHFDIPLLNKYYPGDLTQIKSLDILAKIKEAIDKRISLDSVAAGTLGDQKSAHGLEAVAWWEQGEIEKIRKYCQQDVKITKEIYDFARKNNFLRYKVIDEIKQFPIDASKWEDIESKSINYTLPF
jgi:DEAD/DEAH box helicase domain-containing protein